MITLLTMVRNVEDTLPFMLDSAIPHTDGVVALMAGESADDTEKVLLAVGAKAKKVPWEDNFALARNQLFDYARECGVQWGLLLDGDDVLLEGGALTEPDGVGAMLPIQHYNCRYYQRRIFNLGVPGKWVGRAHETYAAEGVFPQLPAPTVQHVPGKKAAGDVDRNLTIFRRWLEEAPEEWDGHIWFNYGNELYWHRQWLEAAEAYGKANGWIDEQYFARIKQGRSLWSGGKRDEAWACFAEAAKLKPHWHSAYFEMSRWFYYRDQWELCVLMDGYARTRQPPDTYAVVDVRDYSVGQAEYMSYALGKLGRIEDALKVTRDGLELEPNNAMLLQNLKVYSDR